MPEIDLDNPEHMKIIESIIEGGFRNIMKEFVEAFGKEIEFK
jgi:hypothetical protein